MYVKRRILVIAGSDSSGGAGLEADQKVIAAHGCYAMTATAALTAQNTKGVIDVHVTPAAFVAKQIDACAVDIGVDVVKTGMLACAETISVVAKALITYGVPWSVVDPVMVSTSGHRLLPELAIRTLIDELLPVTSLLTPNIPEAKLLLAGSGQVVPEVSSVADMKHLAKTVAALGARNVLIKGGHCPMSRNTLTAADSSTPTSNRIVVNVLYSADTSRFHVFTSSFSDSANTHGTGCSLASAIACNLCTQPLVPAISAALRYVNAGIMLSQPLGSGSGPINHFHSLQYLPFSPGSFVTYLLTHPTVLPHWKAYIHHPFVKRLANGTLPRASFRHYMKQDYLYLTSYARAHSLSGYKATDLDAIAASAAIVGHIRRETALHVGECKAMGISEAELGHETEDIATLAYSRFLLDEGSRGDWFGLQVALGSCLVGYAVAAVLLARAKGWELDASRLPDVALVERFITDVEAIEGEVEDDAGQASGRQKGPGQPEAQYDSWIRNYIADDYLEAVRVGCALLEAHATLQSPSRVEELVKIFAEATRLEVAFWDQSLAMQDDGPVAPSP